MAKGCHRFRYREISVEITGSGQYSSLEVVNAMTNEAIGSNDSEIAWAIDFDGLYGGFGAIRWRFDIWKLFCYRIH